MNAEKQVVLGVLIAFALLFSLSGEDRFEQLVPPFLIGAVIFLVVDLFWRAFK